MSISNIPADLHDCFLRFSPEEIVTSACQMFEGKLVMSTSFGTGSAVLLHMVIQSGYSIPIIHLKAQDREPVAVAANEAYASTLHAWFAAQGFEFAICEYNAFNKLESMGWILRNHHARAVLQGIRADQSDYRKTRRHVEPTGKMFRIYPLLRMTQEEMADYLGVHDIPIHPLGLPGKKTTAECGLHL